MSIQGFTFLIVSIISLEIILNSVQLGIRQISFHELTAAKTFYFFCFLGYTAYNDLVANPKNNEFFGPSGNLTVHASAQQS
jgi:hypothetical protein